MEATFALGRSRGLSEDHCESPQETRLSPLVYFPALRTFGVFLIGLAADAFATAPGIKKFSSFLPDLMAAASHLGLRPRPAQVSAGFSGLRYLGATEPIRPAPTELACLSAAAEPGQL
jgi:hypothetical protein